MSQKGGVYIRSKSVSDEHILVALLECQTIEAAAKYCGISTQTIYRRLANPQFKQVYAERRQRIVEQACSNLQNRITEAVEALAEIMADGEANKMARVLAAKAVLEFGLRSVEVTSILPRLEALENGNQHGGSVQTRGERPWE